MIYRSAAKRCVASLLLLSVPVSSVGRAAETAKSPTGGRLRAHFESGVLAGKESTNLIGSGSVDVRFLAATGLEVRVFPQDSLVRGLGGFGLEYTAAIGHLREDKWETRQAVGPAVSWRMGEDWLLHDMIGVVWSSMTDAFDHGYQVRNGIIYRDVVSVEFVWQTLPVATRDARVGTGSVTSLYAGFALHGEPGVYFVLAAMAGVVIVAIVGARVSSSTWGD